MAITVYQSPKLIWQLQRDGKVEGVGNYKSVLNGIESLLLAIYKFDQVTSTLILGYIRR